MTFSLTGNVLSVTNNATGARMGSVSVNEEFKATVTGLTTLPIDARGLVLAGSGTLVFSRGNARDSLVISGYGRVTR
jgi:hypothetical protein